MKGYEALKALTERKKIRRKGWPEGEFVEIVIYEDKWEMIKNFPDHLCVNKDDILTSIFRCLVEQIDWEVVE